MNERYFINEEELEKFLAKTNYDVYMPVSEKKAVRFRKCIDTSFLSFYKNTTIPPKELFFKQTETLFEYKTGKDVEINEEFETNEILVFGIRACDANALLILDKYFGEPYADFHYSERRKKSILIGLECNPWYNCFCTSVGINPNSRVGVDVFCINYQKKFIFEPLTEKGKRLIDEHDRFFGDVKDRAINLPRNFSI
ncbi:MAG: hypothetical protein AB1779_07935, partial [Candidatus Thermoplasmatota archaeon]